MIICKHQKDLVKYLDEYRKAGKKIGFAPTMGALHEGHMSLIRKARQESDLVVSSIFVNPTQFNDPSDFEKYPVTLGPDIQMLEQEGCDLLYLPGVMDIYPHGTSGLPKYELGFIETVWEGQYRPGHFQGVCQVVDILLTAVSPDLLFMGQKDYQQCMVVARLLDLTGRNHLKLVVCPTLREENGLAMSSRNRRLSKTDREKASLIHSLLVKLNTTLSTGALESQIAPFERELTNQGFRIDYLGLADAKTLEPVNNWDGIKPLVALAAVFLGEVRLIDNLLINSSK